MILFLAPVFVLAQEGTNIVVEGTAGTSIFQEAMMKFAVSWPWYVTRASGLIAFVLFLILMLSGVGFITGRSYKILEPITAWATHRALGIAMGIAILIHIGSLYFDQFVHFDFASLLIPFVSNYKVVDFWGISIGSIWVAFGIFAFYIILLTIITSLIWINKKPKTWKFIHILNYFGAILIFLHALYLGTDLSAGVLRAVFIILGILILIASGVRLWRIKTT